jgi:hypothetical protein
MGTPLAQHVAVEQALYHRRDDQTAELQGRSAAFADDWLPEAERIIHGFGFPPGGVACPLAVFALPLAPRQVTVVRVAAQADGAGRRCLAFHFLVMDRASYERFVGDPFALARGLPTAWGKRGELPALSWPAEPLPARTVADVQKVLRRVKASALRDDEDPESPDFQRTVENSESPALLGGVQVLVDGGKLVFTRPQSDLALVESLWTLLPYSTRGKLWPASFAFGNDLGFDVIVVPRLNVADFEGYTTEEQAALYPQGSYELALQMAAESGDQRELETVFRRRNSSEVLRLALVLLAGMALLVIGSRWLGPSPSAVGEQQRKAAAAAGIIAVGDPWTAASMLEYGHRLWTR